jgi:hypothetical protein
MLGGILACAAGLPVSNSKEKFCGWRKPKHLAELR